MNTSECSYCTTGDLETLSGKKMKSICLLLALASVTSVAVHSLYPESGNIASRKYAKKYLFIDTVNGVVILDGNKKLQSKTGEYVNQYIGTIYKSNGIMDIRLH